MPTRARTQSESAFLFSVMAYLKTRGGWWHKATASRFSSAGVPDILGCYRGVFVSFELKAPGAYANPIDGCTEIQLHVGRGILDAKGFWCVADDITAIGNVLNAIDAWKIKAPKS